MRWNFPSPFWRRLGTRKQLRKGETNKSDLGGVLQTNNIHIAVAGFGEVTKGSLRAEGQPGHR